MRVVPLCDGIAVSELCYGTLTVGPLQKGLTPDEGGRLLRYAFEQGVNFFDTAELYETYAHLRAGLYGHLNDAVIATKSYACTREAMEQSLLTAMKELGRSYIDIMLLHEQESVHTLKGHMEALEYLLTMKEKGYVRAVGISTHHVPAVRAACAVGEIDIIHPLINVAGVGIQGGTRCDMEHAISDAAMLGKGIYAMKALAGGALYSRAYDALRYVRGLYGVSAVAVGMGSVEDIDANCTFFTTGAFNDSYMAAREGRRVIIEPWCEACGECVKICPTHALRIEDGKAVVSMELCLLCGYCVAHCKDFYVKVI